MIRIEVGKTEDGKDKIQIQNDSEWEMVNEVTGLFSQIAKQAIKDGDEELWAKLFCAPLTTLVDEEEAIKLLKEAYQARRDADEVLNKIKENPNEGIKLFIEKLKERRENND